MEGLRSLSDWMQELIGRLTGQMAEPPTELENTERKVNLCNKFISGNIEFQNSERLGIHIYGCGAQA